MYYTDATFCGMLNYYFDADSWINFNIKQGMEIENKALNNCSLAIFASRWAAETAIKYHDASENKICVINRGANVDVQLSLESLIQSLHKRNVFTKEDMYRILFVGKDWERKGGPLALDIIKKLNDIGIHSKLIIIGCTPKIPFEYNQFVDVVGFLNRNIEEEYVKLQGYFLSSDLYLQPSRKECQGIAYLEASAYGLPIIVTDTGVSDVVTSRNGFLLEPDASVNKYTEVITNILSEKNKYEKLALEAYKFYIEDLNWRSVGFRPVEKLNEVINEEG